jgi:excisionase family DNA binding protein
MQADIHGKKAAAAANQASRAFGRNRSMLSVGEVAPQWRSTRQHIVRLIEEGRLQAVNIGCSQRKHWRVPVASFRDFLGQNDSLGDGQQGDRPRPQA